MNPARLTAAATAALVCLGWGGVALGGWPGLERRMGHKCGDDGCGGSFFIDEAMLSQSKYEQDASRGTLVCPLPYKIDKDETCPRGWRRSRIRDGHRRCSPPKRMKRTIPSNHRAELAKPRRGRSWNSMKKLPLAEVTCVDGSVHGKATFWRYPAEYQEGVATRREGAYFKGYPIGPHGIWTVPGWDGAGRVEKDAPKQPKPRRRDYERREEFAKDLAAWTAKQTAYRARLRAAEGSELLEGSCYPGKAVLRVQSDWCDSVACWKGDDWFHPSPIWETNGWQWRSHYWLRSARFNSIQSLLTELEQTKGAFDRGYLDYERDLKLTEQGRLALQREVAQLERQIPAYRRSLERALKKCPRTKGEGKWVNSRGGCSDGFEFTAAGCSRSNGKGVLERHTVGLCPVDSHLSVAGCHPRFFDGQGRQVDRCAEQPGCRERGLCEGWENSVCVPMRHTHCEGSEICAQEGRCVVVGVHLTNNVGITSRHGQCVTPSSSACQQDDRCKKHVEASGAK